MMRPPDAMKELKRRCKACLQLKHVWEFEQYTARDAKGTYYRRRLCQKCHKKSTRG